MLTHASCSLSYEPRPELPALPLAPRFRGRPDHCLRELGAREGEATEFGRGAGAPAPEGLEDISAPQDLGASLPVSGGVVTGEVSP